MPCEITCRANQSELVLSSSEPPFTIAYWCDLGLPKTKLAVDDLTRRFAQVIAESRKSRPRALNASETARESRSLRVVFPELTSERVVVNLANALRARAERGAQVIFTFMSPDQTRQWADFKSMVQSAYLFGTQSTGWRLRLRIFTDFGFDVAEMVPLLLNYPSVEFHCAATAFEECDSIQTVAQALGEGEIFTRAREAAEAGAFVHWTIPITGRNVCVLPEMTRSLLNLTRGGRIKLEPNTTAKAPSVPDYVAQSIRLYKTCSVPIAFVDPLSSIITSLQASEALPFENANAGLDIAVSSAGQMYGGERHFGDRRFLIGSVLDSVSGIRWEVFDLLQESWSLRGSAPNCRPCEWFHRCGGIGAGIHGPSAEVENSLFCVQRKELFEIAFWDFVRTQQSRGERERLDIEKECLKFEPVRLAQNNSL